MIEVPSAFKADILRLGGDEGRVWLAALPRVVGEYATRWRLTLDGDPLHGGLGIVLPARRGDEPCVLKLSWRDSATAHETCALRAWDGAGAVRLLAEDRASTYHALLMERLDPHRSLADLPVFEAVDIAGELLRRLSIPAPDGTPSLREWAVEFARSVVPRARECGVPAQVAGAAAAVAQQLGPSSGTLLVHTDLHFRNVLAGRREPWLAIDPKVVAGDPEFAVGPLLWRRIRIADGSDPEDPATYAGQVNAEVIPVRLDRLIRAARLDERRAYGWALVRCVDYELWGRSVGLTMDPARCAALVEALLATSV